MVVPVPLLVLSAFLLEPYRVETTQNTLNSMDASFCHGGLEVVYPELDVDKCLKVPTKLREKITMTWQVPRVYFTGAQKGNALRKGEIQGTTLTDYHQPTPPQNSGFHRYQFMLFKQPPDTLVSLTDQEKSSRGKWDLQAFITRFGLGEPVASVQFLTQNFKD
ncbi:phosphatidylethanolamine-binding protein 4 isoform X2 [Nothobranchius furzeri]|uniref:phosphatidylethanolamine-binding protein 4 isoform X2 n=1 Tax=Nothobranchius furzeri TaxID=105023 RepID=UPI002403D58C|nr:phosphatidylethanolamine-binding protein 4 isoform X2 [Nothobranchius furzeri]